MSKILKARLGMYFRKTSVVHQLKKRSSYEPDVIDLVSGLDDTNVDVGAGAHVVQDSSCDRVTDQLLRLLLTHVRLPTELLLSFVVKYE